MRDVAQEKCHCAETVSDSESVTNMWLTCGEMAGAAATIATIRR